MKIISFQFKFYWNMFPVIQLSICTHWFRKWLGAEWATSHYLDQRWPSLLMHTCVTRPQWVNESHLRKKFSSDHSHYSTCAPAVLYVVEFYIGHRLFHAPTCTTSRGCLVLHRTVHALWNLYGNPHKNHAEKGRRNGHVMREYLGNPISIYRLTNHNHRPW